MADESTAAAGGAPPRRRALAELALLFVRLGLTAFGGPAAHIAMMEDEVVARRRWLTSDEFLDLLGATNLIPGPNSTEMAIHIGHRRAGWPGLLVAGVAFIVPAAALTLALAWAYLRFGKLPAAVGVLYGIKPIVIAVVVQAIWKLGKTAIKTWPLAALAVAATAAAALGVNELVVLAAAGAATAIVSAAKRRSTRAAMFAPLPLLPVAAGASTPLVVGLAPLFLSFLKIGAVLFGSGYVLVAFMRTDLVEHHHWLTEGQLLDAVAAGQVTPGPVFSTATFVGYLLAGVPGAGVATLGIFLPAFVFVAISGPLVPRMRRSPTAGALLTGVNVASLALMAVVSVELARASLVDLPTLLLAIASTLALLMYRVNSLWLILGGAAVGLLVRHFG